MTPEGENKAPLGYEEQRLANIRKNNEILQSLGLNEVARRAKKGMVKVKRRTASVRLNRYDIQAMLHCSTLPFSR